MKLFRLLLVVFVALWGSRATLAENLTATGADGRSLQVIATFPSGDRKVPAIVLAPGQGYHMNLPVLEEAATALASQGMAVFRFNWGYFSSEPKGQPSDDLSKELQDVQAVLALARQHPRVAADQVAVGGKSLGSLVAWRALAADPRLRAAWLLTPVCSRLPAGDSRPRAEAHDNYPGLAAEERPSLWISGDRDPLCATQVLYAFAGASAKARVAVVAGDHSFENRALPPADAALVRQRTLAAVSALGAAFVAEALNVLP